MRILITGSRDWDDIHGILVAIREAADGFNRDEPKQITLVHGAAAGADSIAARWAMNLGWTVEEHPANWRNCGNNCGDNHYRYRNGYPYCPRAGFVRNSEMVKLGADICLAFIKDSSKGASMTAELAEKAGIPTRRYIQGED